MLEGGGWWRRQLLTRSLEQQQQAASISCIVHNAVFSNLSQWYAY
jgi:hypothetical protein